jgi:hypothetical protein
MLALAICLKLTPALFVLYWVWQREWMLLASTFAALVLLILSPAAFTGWPAYATSMATWWGATVGPGWSGTQWYPASINQSLPAAWWRRGSCAIGWIRIEGTECPGR